MTSATATQNPDPFPNGNWSAYRAIDSSKSTCSSTGESTKPTWSVQFSNQSIDVGVVNMVLRLPPEQGNKGTCNGPKLNIKFVSLLFPRCDLIVCLTLVIPPG